MSDKVRGFLCGALLSCGFLSLFLDALGKDRYMRWVEDTWVPEWVSVPLAMVLILLAMVVGRTKEGA